MLLVADLVPGANQIADGFIGGIRDIDGGEFAGAVEPGELVGIAAIGLDAVTRLAWNLGRGEEHAMITVPVEAPGEGKPMWSGFVTTAQFGAGMRGLKFGEEFEHVIMRAADDAVTPDLNRIGGRKTHGNGIGVDIEPDEQHGPVGGCRRASEDGVDRGHRLRFASGHAGRFL